MPKRVAFLRGSSQQFLSKKCRSDGESLATFVFWPAQDLNLRPFALETNVFPLNELEGTKLIKGF